MKTILLSFLFLSINLGSYAQKNNNAILPKTATKSEARLDAVELGNNSAAAKNDFVFSPNPSDGKFTLTYYLKAEHAGWVQISSAEGKGIGKYKISGETSILTIDLSNQASGVYYATIVVEGMVVNKTKLVLEH